MEIHFPHRQFIWPHIPFLIDKIWITDTYTMHIIHTNVQPCKYATVSATSYACLKKLLLFKCKCQYCKKLELIILTRFNPLKWLVVIICITYFSIKTSLHFPTHCIYVLVMILRISINYLRKQQKQVDVFYGTAV